MKTVKLDITLTEAQAWALAQFFKRVSFSEYRSNAIDDAEAYHSRDAGEVMRRALTKLGYDPR